MVQKYPGVFSRDITDQSYKILTIAIKRKSVWLVKTIINQKLDLLAQDKEGNNWIYTWFSSFWFRKLKSSAIVNIIIEKAKSDFTQLYKLCNNYNSKGMLPTHEVIKLGDLDAVEYMIETNK